MKSLKITICLSLLLPLLAAAQNPLALKAKKIFTVSGAVIENGLILIREGKIEKLGQNLTSPPGYEILDFSDGWIYPGLINAMSWLGTAGVGFTGPAGDRGEPGDFNPQITAYTAFYPWSKLIPIVRNSGTLVALTYPSGGMVAGKAVLVSTWGWTPEETFLRKEAALMVQFPESSAGRMRRSAESSEESGQVSRKKKSLVEFFNAASRYCLKIKNGQKPAYDANLEAMRPLWEKNLPVIVTVNAAADIRDAIKLANDLGLHLILAGCYEAEAVLSEIKQSGAGVILPSLYAGNRKWEDGYDCLYRLPASLHRAGIKFVFSMPAAATSFDLPIQAARAVAYGLPEDAALKGLTLYPAEMLGVAGHGAIEPGKVADLVVASGNIFDTATRIKAVLVKGQRITSGDYFQQEFEKARNRVSGELK